jgi:hypothetical protein
MCPTVTMVAEEKDRPGNCFSIGFFLKDSIIEDGGGARSAKGGALEFAEELELVDGADVEGVAPGAMRNASAIQFD